MKAIIGKSFTPISKEEFEGVVSNWLAQTHTSEFILWAEEEEAYRKEIEQYLEDCKNGIDENVGM
jgi:hypothetical protein